MPRRYPEARKWYKTAKWKELRRIILSPKPMCTRCKIKVATLLDHRIPHRGNILLFFDRNNLDPMCKPCHDNYKSNKELGKVDTATDEQGYPVDPNHPWNGS